MLALQLGYGPFHPYGRGQGQGAGPWHPYGQLMGLSADGQLLTKVTESVADRVARIRAQMISIGIPAAVGSGAFTTLVFAGAFGLAHTERVWAPALLLGGVATLAGLVSVAMASRAINTATTTPQTAVVATPPPALPAAFGVY